MNTITSLHTPVTCNESQQPCDFTCQKQAIQNFIKTAQHGVEPRFIRLLRHHDIEINDPHANGFRYVYLLRENQHVLDAIMQKFSIVVYYGKEFVFHCFHDGLILVMVPPHDESKYMCITLMGVNAFESWPHQDIQGIYHALDQAGWIKNQHEIKESHDADAQRERKCDAIAAWAAAGDKQASKRIAHILLAQSKYTAFSRMQLAEIHTMFMRFQPVVHGHDVGDYQYYVYADGSIIEILPDSYDDEHGDEFVMDFAQDVDEYAASSVDTIYQRLTCLGLLSKSKTESIQEAKSINKREIVERWIQSGEQLIAKNFKAMHGQDMPYTPDLEKQLQSQLEKFSPIWRGESIQSNFRSGGNCAIFERCYLYSDGSFIRVSQDDQVIDVKCRFEKNYFFNSSIDAIYDKLVELGLINPDKRALVTNWIAAGDQIIGKRIMSMFGHETPYMPSRLEQIKAMLIKFSPIWHGKSIIGDAFSIHDHDYVFADGSIVHVYADSEEIVIWLPRADVSYFHDIEIYEIYHALVKLDLIPTVETKSISLQEAKSIDKRAVVNQWQARGDKIIARRVQTLVGQEEMPYTHKHMNQIQVLLMKLSPIWYKENPSSRTGFQSHDYVYQDGSFIRVTQNHTAKHNCINVSYFSICLYMLDSEIDEIYDKLVKLGLITAGEIKSKTESLQEAKSIDAGAVVKQWLSRGKKLIGKRIYTIVGQDTHFDIVQWPEIQALLMKFSPVWHEERVVSFDTIVFQYVYQDGSYIRVCKFQKHIELIFQGFRYFLTDRNKDEIYDALVELGLIKPIIASHGTMPLQEMRLTVNYAPVDQWLNQGTKSIARRIENIFGTDKEYDPALYEKLLDLLGKFSPIWHEDRDANGGYIHDYVYSDGSAIHVFAGYDGMYVYHDWIASQFDNSQIDEIYHSLVKLGLIAAGRTKSKVKPLHEITFIDTRAVVQQWAAAGDQLIAHRIETIIGRDRYFTRNQWHVIQALLMKFSPIWHTGDLQGVDFIYHNYVYADGSIIYAFARGNTIQVVSSKNFRPISSYRVIDEIYDKLVELGLIATGEIKSKTEFMHEEKSINKHVMVNQWQAAGDKLIARRIESIIGQAAYFTIDQWPAMQALLMKLSPIWHGESPCGVHSKYYDYVYADGSAINVFARGNTIEMHNRKNSIPISSHRDINEIYDKLVKLGLVQPLRLVHKEGKIIDKFKQKFFKSKTGVSKVDKIMAVRQWLACSRSITQKRIQRMLPHGHDQDFHTLQKFFNKLQPIWQQEQQNKSMLYLYVDSTMVLLYAMPGHAYSTRFVQGVSILEPHIDAVYQALIDHHVLES